MNGNDNSPREAQTAPAPFYGRIVKPAIDLPLSALLFVITLPLLLVLTALVRLLIGAPAFVRVKCSRKNGVIFTRHDLRTVTDRYGDKDDAENGAPSGRVGSLGRWLLRSGLYRLPNLINCLRLEMALTGPRPLDAANYYRYGEDELSRLRVRPGLFTPDYSGCDGWDKVFAADEDYISSLSFKSDAGVFFGGIGRVFKGGCADNAPESRLGAFKGDELPFVKPRGVKDEHQFVLMLTLEDVTTIKQYTPFCDLAREYIDNGHSVVVISPAEKRGKESTHFIGDAEAKCRILRVKTANFRDTGLIGQYIAAVTLDRQVRHAASKYLNGDCFDTVISFAPPYAMNLTCGFIAKRDNAQCIYMAGDRCAESIADIGTVRENTLLYNILRGQEEHMYWLADRILCVSEQYRKWLLSANRWLDPSRVELCRPGLAIHSTRLRPADKLKVREHFEIPANKHIFICIGALDKEHDADTMINCIYSLSDIRDAYIILTGSGEYYPKMLEFFQKFGSMNVNLMPDRSPHEIELLLGGSDVGILFGNYRQTLPTFPQEILYYMQAGLPVLAVTDENCAVKDVIKDGDFGWWACSDNPDNFADAVNYIMTRKLGDYGKYALKRLRRDYDVKDTYKKLCPAGDVSEAEQSAEF